MNLFKRSVAMGVLAVGGVVLAAPTINLSLMKVTVVTKDGTRSEVLTPADKVAPGDVLLQRATLRTDKVLKSGHIMLPVPKNTHYLAGTASTSSDLVIDFSADGGKTFSATPMKTVVVTENGKQVERQVNVAPKDYTNVRWLVKNLTVGAELTVGYRVEVN